MDMLNKRDGFIIGAVVIGLLWLLTQAMMLPVLFMMVAVLSFFPSVIILNDSAQAKTLALLDASHDVSGLYHLDERKLVPSGSSGGWPLGLDSPACVYEFEGDEPVRSYRVGHMTGMEYRDVPDIDIPFTERQRWGVLFPDRIYKLSDLPQPCPVEYGKFGP